MSMSNEEWKNTRRDANRAGRFSLTWVAVVVAVCLLAAAGIWAFNVFVSGPKGQGDAVMQKNSAENWVDAQADFNRRYQDILATDRKITIAKSSLDASPDDQVLRTNYIGLMNYCTDVVAEYNTQARSYLSREFRDADLPEQISTLNPTTDCKE